MNSVCARFRALRDAARGLVCIVLAAAFTSVGCGYQSVRAVMPESGFCLEAGSDRSSYPQAMSAAVNGARDALAQRQLLETSCGEGQTLVVHIVRVQLSTEGIVAGKDSVVANGGPMGRATRVSVTLEASGALGMANQSGTRSDAMMVTEHAVVATGTSELEHENAIGIGVVSA